MHASTFQTSCRMPSLASKLRDDFSQCSCVTLSFHGACAKKTLPVAQRGFDVADPVIFFVGAGILMFSNDILVIFPTSAVIQNRSGSAIHRETIEKKASSLSRIKIPSSIRRSGPYDLERKLASKGPPNPLNRFQAWLCKARIAAKLSRLFSVNVIRN